MGFRFRKSVKIAPGVKLNLSKSGGSLSIGGRGATANISSKGVRSTYTIPGTGISYVTQVSTRKNQRADYSQGSNRAIYRELIKQQKAEEKLRALQDASEAYSDFQHKTESLSNILKEREKQPFNWNEATASRGKYQSKSYILDKFIEPKHNFSENMLRKELQSNKQAKFYVTFSILGLSFILLFQGFEVFLTVLVLAAISYALEQSRFIRECEKHLPTRVREETEKFDRRRQKEYKQHLERVELNREEHLKSEKEKEKKWNKEEQYRVRLKSAVSFGDLEVLAKLLEIELSNEILPIPLVFDIEFISINTVRLLMELPEPDVVPDTRLRLTKTGRLSERAMSQKDRYTIYSNICTGLALRLIYETFRVVHCVEKVELQGLTERINLADGHSESMSSLEIQISRLDFGQLKLDTLDSLSAIASLGGDFRCTKKCELLPVKGV